MAAMIERVPCQRAVLSFQGTPHCQSLGPAHHPLRGKSHSPFWKLMVYFRYSVLTISRGQEHWPPGARRSKFQAFAESEGETRTPPFVDWPTPGNLHPCSEGQSPGSIAPVSYTHLDVYKRQQSTRRIAPWIAPKSAAAPPQRPLDTDTPSRSSATQTATASPPSPPVGSIETAPC